MLKRERPLRTSPKVLAVGTTTDYIHWIRRSCPDRALFLTDPLLRQQAKEPTPAPHEEILCDLVDYEQALETLKNHLRNRHLSLSGITSYDCESMELAAVIARDMSLDYPTVQAVGNCRNKYLSKILWHESGVRTPSGRLVTSSEEAVSFFKQTDGPCVLKPITGSGSELLLYCETADECKRGFNDISRGLKQRQAHRLYRSFSTENPSILIEECIEGEEFSCDFIIEGEQAAVIRLAQKIPDKKGPFGTIRGYILPAPLPDGIDPRDFERALHQGARALGIDRAMCMLDFLVRKGELIFLEIAPRPGGDCLPFLLLQRFNLDILKLNLDFAQHCPVRLPGPDNNHPAVGLRVHAKKGGVLKKIDITPLRHDPRIYEVYLPHRPGYIIRMPPEDYDSWLLGHVIFRPIKDTDVETQCHEIFEQIAVETE